MSQYYILDGKTPVLCEDFAKWVQWYETANRRIADDTVGKVRVRTVFLGIDHNFSGIGEPVLFETMAFGDYSFDACERYRTWDEAEVGHERNIAAIRSAAMDPSVRGVDS